MHDSDSVLGAVKKIPQLTKVHSELNDSKEQGSIPNIENSILG